jgi:hypothetical protein
LRTVVANGDPAPGTTNGRFIRPTSASISPSGKVAFVSQIQEVGVAPRGIWVETDAGLELVAREQAAAPGGGTFDGFVGAPVSYSGWVAFAANTSGASSVFARDGAMLRAIARAGDTVDGKVVGSLTGGLLASGFLTNAAGHTIIGDDNGVLFSVPRTGPGAVVMENVGSRPAFTEEGHIAFVTSGPGEPALRFGTLASLAVLATRRQAGPGMVGDETFEGFGPLGLGADGFLVLVAGAFDENAGDGWDGIFTKSPNGELSLLQKLPITAGNVALQSPTEISVASGSVYILLGATVPDGGGVSKLALVARRAGAFVPIAVQGEPAPGIPGATYSEIGKAHINANGTIVFAATLAGAGITSENATVVYMLPNANANAPEIVVRAGTPIELGGARGAVTPTVVSVPDMPARGGPRALNDAGEALIGVRYPFDGSDGNALLVTAAAGVEPSGAADLALTAASREYSEEYKQGLAGDEFLIRLVVENRGTGVASPVRVELVGVGGKRFSIVEGQGPWSCTKDCRAGDLLPGQSTRGSSA